MLLLGDLIERNARLSPNREAIVDGSRRFSFAEYARRTRRLAGGLRSMGARSQDRIAVLAGNCAEYVECYGACELAGFIIVTLNVRLTVPEIERVLQDSAPRVLVFEEHYCKVVAVLRESWDSVIQFVCIGGGPEWARSYDDVLSSGEPSGQSFSARAGDFLSIIYTSGTTGTPKGVIRTQLADAALADCVARELGTTSDGRMLIMMPFFHIGARGMQLAQHWAGGTCVIHRRFDASTALESIEVERITHAHFAPTMFQDLLASASCEQRDLRSLRTVSYGAGPMPVPLLRRGIARLGQIFTNLYGATEGHVTCLGKLHHVVEGTQEQMKRLGSVGQVSLGADIRIVDAEGNECPAGVPGEITLRAPWMTVGYWNNSVATAEALRAGWLRFGDIGVLDGDGFLYLVDRKKDMIVSGGENIYSREVEIALLEHQDVVDAAVIGVPDDRWGESVSAFVVLRAGACVDDIMLVEHCRRLIARYKCPKSVSFVDELPRMPSGKISKMELRRRYAQRGGNG